MIGWKSLFKPWILDRGREYFECGQVLTMDREKGVVRASVSGSQEYHVEIRIGGNRVVRMACDCPYAAGGENCKHMAAVLLTVEDEQKAEIPDWRDALEKMPEAQLREVLRSLAETDIGLQRRILRMTADPGDPPSQWLLDLDCIITSYTNYDGGIDYENAYDCMVELARYMADCLPPLLTSERAVEAAKLVMTVYSTAFDLDIDDSDGGLSIVSGDCREALEQILSMADASQEREIFDLLHDHLEENDWIYGSEDLEDVILSLEWSPELAQEHLEWLDAHLEPHRLSRRAELMAHMGASATEQIAWWEQFRGDESAYHPLLRLYEAHDPRKAMELVRQERAAKNRNKDHYTKTLLGLLERTGDQAEYERELRYLVVKLKCRDTEYLSRLKQITPECDWSRIVADLLTDTPLPWERCRMYQFEGMYEELFGELCRYPSYGSFREYEMELREWSPERTRDLLVELLKREMQNASQRTQYRRIIEDLRKLYAYPGGPRAEEELVAYWFLHHKNRSAMKDELRQAGYRE